MKKRIISFILMIIMLLSVMPIIDIPASAASTLSISSPKNNTYISKSDFTYVKWNSVTGAAGYRITIVDGNTGELYTSERNMWVGTSTKYSISNILDDISEYPLLKIWVGAMKTSDANSDVISSDVVWAGLCEAPDITNKGSSNITSTSATLSMSVDKNYGISVDDAGFYIGTSTSQSKANKYSVDDYGSGVKNSGTMTMTVTGLDANTTYYYWAYAENGLDETVSSRKSFTTSKSSSATQFSLSKTSVSLGWGSGNEDTVTVTYSGSYSYSIEYDVSSSVQSGGYDYEWLKVQKSGDTLRIYPDRANYSASARKAYIDVTCGGETKTITVTQKACGESAPTITIKRAGTVVTNEINLGSFPVWKSGDPALNIQADWENASNVRKISALMYDVSTGLKVGEYHRVNPASSGLVSIDASSYPAGNYKMIIYASNSDTANDYWKQNAIANGSVTLYFSLTNSGSGSGSGNNGELSAKRQAAVDRAYAWYNKTWTLKEDLEVWHKTNVNGTVIPAGTVVRGIPYTQVSCKYSIDGTLPGSSDYFLLSDSNKYLVDTFYCAGVEGNRVTPKYGAECVQLVYDPYSLVRDRLLKLDASHIEYIFTCMDSNTTEIHNIKQYLLKTLINAPTTVEAYYTTKVHHDLYGGQK